MNDIKIGWIIPPLLEYINSKYILHIGNMNAEVEEAFVKKLQKDCRIALKHLDND